MTQAVLRTGPGRGPDEDSGRWMGVGRSIADDPAAAASAAHAAATRGRTPTLVLAFCSSDYDVPALVEALRADLPAGAVLAGCTTNGQLSPAEDVDGRAVDRGVVVLALGGSGLQAAVRLERDASANRREAGAAAATVVDDLTAAHQVCLLLADVLTLEHDDIVRGGFATLGAMVPLVGGCSGDDFAMERTQQFTGSVDGVDVVSDGLVAVGLGADAPFGVGVAHGWSRVGKPMLVTDSHGGRVLALDNEPALEVYLDRLGLDPETARDPVVFREAALLAPLGLSRRNGEDLRIIGGADFADGSLLALAEIPQGAMVWQMSASAEGLVAAADRACAAAIEELDGREPVGVLVFDCGVRKRMLGSAGLQEEQGALTRAARGAPVAGFYTHGEIARIQGARGMHFMTLVCLALS